MATVDFILVLCALVSLSFGITYLVLAPWHRSWLGRQVMAMSVILFMSLSYLAARSVEWVPTEGTWGRRVLDWTIFPALLAVLVWQLALLIRYQWRRRK